MRITVLTDDRLGPAMAGSALRAWELARVLAAAGHQVRIGAAPGSEPPAAEGPPVAAGTRLGDAEAVLSAPWNLPPRALLGRRVLILDGVTPLLAELDAMLDGPEVRHRRRTARARLALALARADAVLAAGPAQAAWWRDALRRAGRPGVPVLDVPFGIPAADPPQDTWAPPGLPDGWAMVLWWGGVWPWLDLETLLAARARLGAAPLAVVVPVGVRPGGRSTGLDLATLRDLVVRHGLEPPQVVPLKGWLPYAERHRLLNRATLLAVLHHGGREAELAFRTRALDGLWAGVPLLLSEGGAVAGLAREHGWGAVAPVHDAKAVAAAMELMASEREQRRCRRAMAASRAAWRWPRVAAPLVEILPELPVAPRRSLALPALTAGLELLGLGRGRW